MIQAILQRIDTLIGLTERRALLDDERMELRRLIPSVVAEATDAARLEKKPRLADLLRRPRWFKLISFWDSPAKRIMEVDEKQILLQGTMHGDQLAICLVPQAIGPTQGEALRVLLEANLRMPVVILSNNINLMRLKPISDGIANQLMKEGVSARQTESDVPTSEPK